MGNRLSGPRRDNPPSARSQRRAQLSRLSSRQRHGYDFLSLPAPVPGFRRCCKRDEYICTPNQAYVESTVVCTKIGEMQSCAVTAQRLSKLFHQSTQPTYLSFSQTFSGLSALLPNATQHINHIDLLQNYLADPDNDTFIKSAQWPIFSNNESRSLDLSLEDFGTRLGQPINTYLFGSMHNSTGRILASPQRHRIRNRPR